MTIVRPPVNIASLRVLCPHLHDGSSPQEVAKFPFTLHICQGSIVGFRPEHQPSAIVNAANAQCLGGGGVDGAISNAGGSYLYQDRLQLPIVQYTSQGQAIRCPTGSAVVTGPGSYGSLYVPYIIHAVGPDYSTFDNEQFDQADMLLQSAYQASLQIAGQEKMHSIAFSLLSAGIYRGKRTLKRVLEIGLESIIHFDGYEQLKDVTVCAFLKEEVDTLLQIIHSFKESGLVEFVK